MERRKGTRPWTILKVESLPKLGTIIRVLSRCIYWDLACSIAPFGLMSRSEPQCCESR